MEEKKRSLPLALAVTLVAVLLVPCSYVASIGPFVRYLDEPSRAGTWKVYGPVQWAYDHTPLRRPIEMYVWLWRHWGRD